MKILNKFAKGFTFVELMVVVSIAAIMFAVATVSYQNVSKSSRDARRKSDMEAIRQSLELVRSSSGSYPSSIYANCSPLDALATSAICSATQVYMKVTPKDPKDSSVYSYTPLPAGGPTYVTYTIQSSLMESVTNPYKVYNP